MSQPKLNHTTDVHFNTQLHQTQLQKRPCQTANAQADTALLETKSKPHQVLTLLTSLLALLLCVTDSTMLDF